jgi:hypothetical protein
MHGADRVFALQGSWMSIAEASSLDEMVQVLELQVSACVCALLERTKRRETITDEPYLSTYCYTLKRSAS